MTTETGKNPMEEMAKQEGMDKTPDSKKESEGSGKEFIESKIAELGEKREEEQGYIDKIKKEPVPYGKDRTAGHKTEIAGLDRQIKQLKSFESDNDYIEGIKTSLEQNKKRLLLDVPSGSRVGEALRASIKHKEDIIEGFESFNRDKKATQA
ncbi:hypothetical protein ACFL0Z_03740 [Patescibacteria group bacterium]